MVIAIQKEENYLLISESPEQAIDVFRGDLGWGSIEDFEFYTDQGQRLMLREDDPGAYRLTPHDRPKRENLLALFESPVEIHLTKVDGVNSITDLKRELGLEDPN